MKYLIVLLVVVMVGWLMLRGRSRPGPVSRGATPAPKPQEVVECCHCGVHLPRAEAVEDRSGMFCSEAHRLAGPRSP
jgi:uncharacterized protein